MRCPTDHTMAKYIADRCSARQQRQISLHIDECARCQQEVAIFHRLTNILETLPPAQMPANLWSGVAERIATHPQHHIFRRFWPALAGVGVAASLLAGLLLTNHQQPLLPSPSLGVAEYVSQHQLLSARDPFADRASLGVILASEQGSQ